MNPSVNVAVNLNKVYSNELIKGTNLKVNRESNTIKDIFLTYWNSFHHLYNDRIVSPEIDKNINTFLKCGSFENGYLFYTCPNCGKYHISAFTCKSRFCTSCAHKYRDARALAMFNKCVDSSYRYIVFTMPEELRIYFKIDRKLLDLLFKVLIKSLYIFPLVTSILFVTTVSFQIILLFLKTRFQNCFLIIICIILKNYQGGDIASSISLSMIPFFVIVVSLWKLIMKVVSFLKLRSVL